MKSSKAIYKIIKFDDTQIEKYKFHQYKSPILTDNVDVNEIVVSNKVSLGKNDVKYFISYKDAKKIDLCIFLPRMSRCRRDFDKT